MVTHQTGGGGSVDVSSGGSRLCPCVPWLCHGCSCVIAVSMVVSMVVTWLCQWLCRGCINGCLGDTIMAFMVCHGCLGRFGNINGNVGDV